MASTKALDRLSSMPLITPAKWVFKVLASFLKGSSRERVAQLNQALRSA